MQRCRKLTNDPEYDAVVERVFVIYVDAFDGNCQQHIIPRFTEAQIRDVLAPIEDRIRSLEMENESLQRQLAESKPSPAVSMK
jgi:hypothetical protein